MTQSKNIEASFIASFFFLITALVVTLGVMILYAPQSMSRFFGTDKLVSQQASPQATVSKPTQASSARPRTPPPQTAEPTRSSFAKSSRAAAPFGATHSAAPNSQANPAAAAANLSQKAEPADVDTLLNEAMSLVDQGKPQEATAALEKILTLDPQNEMALVEMGMLQLIDLKNPDKAVGYLESALKINPNNKVVLSELVGIYDELGQSHGGLTFLQNLYEERPDNPGLASAIGQMMAGQNRLNDALPFLERAAEENPNGTAIADLGDTYSRLGMKDKALETYQRAIDLEQERVDSGFYSQDVKMGNENLAMAYMDKIAELVQQKRYSEAEEIMETKVKKIVGGDLKEIAKLFDRSRDSQTR